MEDAAPRARKLGRYTLLQRIAAGGMGEVHLARLDSIQGVGKFFAIKLLLPQFVEEQSVVDMFVTEARIAARIAHPNVCQVFELGLEDDELFICMEYLRGVPATSILRAHKPANPVNVRIAVGIIQQAAHGLQFAHELLDESGESLGVVHRDVSPGNIFITTTGTSKVLDFGVVKAKDSCHKTKTGALKGKFGYMSPEQIMATELDNRSDIFSLGIVLFELLTNRRLFTRDSDYATLKAITELPIPTLASFRPDLPAELGAVLARAMARDLDTRYVSMKAFGSALSEAMRDHGGVADGGEISDFISSKFTHEIGEIDKMLKMFPRSSAPSAPIRARRRVPSVVEQESTKIVEDGIAVSGSISSGSVPSGSISPGSVPAGFISPGSVPAGSISPGSVPAGSISPGSVPAGSAPAVDSSSGLSGAKSEVTAVVYDSSGKSGTSAMAIAVGVVGLGIIGLLAALLIENKSPSQPQSSIVFQGGSLERDNGKTVAGATPVVPDAAMIDADLIDASTNEGGKAGVKPLKKKHKCEKQGSWAKRNSCYVSVERRGLSRCLNLHSSDAVGTSRIELGFDLDRRGKIKNVSIEPEQVASTTLGTCLKGVAQKVKFGPQQKNRLFSIPLKITQ